VATAESTYGSDKAGMVCGYFFRTTEPGAELDSDAAAAWLANAQRIRGEFLWLHFNLSNTASLRWIEQQLELPDAFREAAGANSSTRVEAAGDFLIAVVNDLLFHSQEASSASTLIICVDPRVLVSARVTPLRSIDRLRASVKAGEVFRSPVELLAHLLLAQAMALSRSRLGSLRRTLVRIQRLLAPEPAALFRLLNRPPSWISADDVRDLRQSAEELAAAVADSAALVERVRLLQEELVALVNEQTGRTLFVLTVVTVLALPMTIIPGFFGMNVGGVPFSGHGGGFWLVVALVVSVVGVGALWAYTRGRHG
jgi:zinc transporter